MGKVALYRVQTVFFFFVCLDFLKVRRLSLFRGGFSIVNTSVLEIISVC